MPTVAGIYTINLTINFFVESAPANYWYLMDKPAGDSLAVFMPEAPYHILGIAPLALIVFFITYVPFLLWDKFKKA